MEFPGIWTWRGEGTTPTVYAGKGPQQRQSGARRECGHQADRMRTGRWSEDEGRRGVESGPEGLHPWRPSRGVVPREHDVPFGTPASTGNLADVDHPPRSASPGKGNAVTVRGRPADGVLGGRYVRATPGEGWVDGVASNPLD